MRRLLLWMVLLSGLFSCSTRFEKYKVDWIVNTCLVDDVDFSENLMKFNFSIYKKLQSAYPPSLQTETSADQKKSKCKIHFSHRNGKDYIELIDHYFFSGTYEIKCLDESCCTVTLQNERIFMQMDYNGDWPFGRTRNCPAPRSPF